MKGRPRSARWTWTTTRRFPPRYGIRSIPFSSIFKNGEVVDQIVGAVPKAQLKKQLEAQLAN
ncbi:MAG: hypothetical protein U5K31_05295 [Balneolaceae bacterium]|nr:hypothetical protein [Balneolaceae bacterium]